MLMNVNRRAYYSEPLDGKANSAFVLLFHGIVTGGVAILATGASKLESSNLKSTDASTDAFLVKAGIALLTLSWVVEVVVSVWTLAHPGNFRNSSISAGKKVNIHHIKAWLYYVWLI